MTRKTNKVLSATLAAFVLLACAQTAAYATDTENNPEEATSIETVLDTESLEAAETEAIEEDTEVPEIETGVWNDTCTYEWDPNTKTLVISGISTKTDQPIHKNDVEHLIINAVEVEDMQGFAMKTLELHGCNVIRMYAFEGCANLETVIIDKGCYAVKEGSFSHCNNIRDLFVYNPECDFDLMNLAYIPGSISGTVIHCYANTGVFYSATGHGYTCETITSEAA